jgi:hypothetical protein
VPVVQPRRIGVRSADPPGTVRSDVVTLARVREGAIPAAVDQPVAGTLTVRPEAGCPPASAACGLLEDDHVAVFHESGRHDFLVVDAVAGLAASVSPRQSGPPANFSADAVAVAVETETYFFDQPRRQLRLYDGYRSDLPIVDDVVAVRFDYFGEAGVPSRARTAGDSCWFDDQGLPKYGRTVTPAGAALVRLPLNEFEDGPWCGQGENRFDADLLRVRFVRAVLRLRASASTARGRSVAFVDPGRAASGRRFVPDLEVEIGSSLRVPGGN